MNFSKLSTLVALSVSTLFSLSLNAKTLVIDDFLKHQDTSDIKFDFAQPDTHLTPYKSQFDNDSRFKTSGVNVLNPYAFSLDMKNDDFIFKTLLKSQEGLDYDNLNEFEKRKYTDEVKKEYVQKYKSFVKSYNDYIDSIDTIRMNNLIFEFDYENYDFDKQLYLVEDSSDNKERITKGAMLGDQSRYYPHLFEHDIYKRKFIGKLRYYIGLSFVEDVFNRYWNSNLRSSSKFKMVIDMPIDVAEKLYNLSSKNEKKVFLMGDFVFRKDINCVYSEYDNCFRPVLNEFSFRFLEDIEHGLVSRAKGTDLNQGDMELAKYVNVLFKTNSVTVLDEDENGQVNYIYKLEKVSD